MTSSLTDRLYDAGLTPHDEYGVRCEAAAEIKRLREVLKDCQFRLWGQGPSTDPLYARVRDALASHG